MSDLEKRFHDTWLGMAQPYEGLVVSTVVLTDAQCMQRHGPAEQARLAELVGEESPCITDYPRFYEQMLGLKAEHFDTGAALPEDLRLEVVEGHQTIRPTRALRRRSPPPPRASEGLPDDSTPASRAGEPYLMLIWELPARLPLDAKETVTGPWHYEPQAKFDRLLRHCRVPVGLLANGEELRLVYAPHGESSGHLTFRLKDLVTPGGRPLLDALLMLLHARRFFAVAEEHTLPALLEQSRRRQASVTEALAGQVYEALQILLTGFQGAAERDQTRALAEALEKGGDHVYGGLLTVLLRLVFLLYAEDRGLLPVGEEPYEEDLSVKSLYEQLQADAGSYPDAMSRRFGAWPRLLALFRTVYFGASHGRFHVPSRKGELFDPETYPFLEGWTAGGAPVSAEDRASVTVPSVDDETVYRVLERLLVLEGQRLSYQALDVEQIGSVYEALMGYHVKRLGGSGVCTRSARAWADAAELLEIEPSRRASWLEEECGLDGKSVKSIADALKKAKDEEAVVGALEPLRVRNVPVAAAGTLVLQPGAERRRTSSHYTPRSLSAPIVRRALEPLFKAMGDAPASERILNLKICDPAMGSGAFLVEACRFLGDQLVAAWTREGKVDLAPKGDDIVMRARRLIAQRCLYGVDRNPFAVSLAKLSLWLVTLAKDEPFTFLDHALRCGDSLLGLDLEQIEAFHWKPGRQLDWAEKLVKTAVEDALERRQAILAMATEMESPGAAPTQLHFDSAGRKQELLRAADEALEPVRQVADLVLGAFFEGESEKERETERQRRFDELRLSLAAERPLSSGLRAKRDEFRERYRPFHWMLEFPEVFHGKRPDPLDSDQVNRAAWMDSFVGNPPFMGKNGISEFGGPAYLPWLQTLHEGAHGNADYSAHFFRRAFHLLGDHGTFGLIATNTIGQGDTRASGLQAILAKGGVIFEAVRSHKWPGTANVAVAVVHVAKGHLITTETQRRLDGAQAGAINSRLRAKPERPDPRPLVANTGLSFVGTYVLGMGFVLTPERRAELITKDRRNAERIYRYIGGEEVNSDPDPSLERYVINFGDMELAAAERWPDLLTIVRNLVKPERDLLKNNSDGRRRKTYWWQFGRNTPALYAALQARKRCLVNSQVSKHLVFAWRPSAAIFAHTTYVYPVETDRHLAVLQSRVHEGWARLLSSSLEDRLRYAPSDCFEPFPFPPSPAFEALDEIGERLDLARSKYMSAERVGLTTTYNRLKDPSNTDPRIADLRALHEEVDRAVLAAYGWSDLPVPPYCGADPKALEAFQDEVIDRLFALNEERARQEDLLGAHSAPAKKSRPSKPRKPPRPRP
jgi:hypothetical protein